MPLRRAVVVAVWPWSARSTEIQVAAIRTTWQTRPNQTSSPRMTANDASNGFFPPPTTIDVPSTLRIPRASPPSREPVSRRCHGIRTASSTRYSTASTRVSIRSAIRSPTACPTPTASAVLCPMPTRSKKRLRALVENTEIAADRIVTAVNAITRARSRSLRSKKKVVSGARSNTARTAERADANQLSAVSRSAAAAMMLLQPSTRDLKRASRSMAPEPLASLMSPGMEVDRMLTTAFFRSGFD